MTGHDDVPFVGTFWPPMHLLAIDRGAEEVSPGVYIRSIDIVVLGVLIAA
jgi:hypothetical protein